MNFRIGATSDTYPNDLITNVHGLKNIVSCIQLNLFNSRDFSLLPTRLEIQKLREIADDCDLKYTVHLPLDIDICSDKKDQRNESLRKIIHIHELTKDLDPCGLILHLERYNISNSETWIENTFDSLDRLYREIPKNRLLIENVGNYRSRIIYPILDFYSSFICLDISHAVKAGDNWEEIYDKYSNRIRLIHFYGPETAYGHEGLQNFSRHFISGVITKLIETNYREFVILEIFNELDFFESKKIFEQEISNHYRRILQKVV